MIVWMYCPVVQIYAEKASQIRSLSFPDKNSSSSLTADWLNPLQDSIYLSGEALRSKNQCKYVNIANFMRSVKFVIRSVCLCAGLTAEFIEI